MENAPNYMTCIVAEERTCNDVARDANVGLVFFFMLFCNAPVFYCKA